MPPKWGRLPVRALILFVASLFLIAPAALLAAASPPAETTAAAADVDDPDDPDDAATPGATETPAPTESPAAEAPAADETGAPGNLETRAIAEDPLDLAPSDAAAAGIALLRLFVLAVVLERALSLLFDWRPFLAWFDGAGVRTPIAFAAAMAITHYFQSDALVRLFQAYGNPLPEATDSTGLFLARTLEAMVIAGGSSGVAKLMRSLGFRPAAGAEDARPVPKNDDEAWISVALDGKPGSVSFPAYVVIAQNGKPAYEAGTIYRFSGPQSFTSYFFRNRGRFPQSAGHPVDVGKTIAVAVVDSAGRKFEANSPHTPGPRAIIDIVIDAE